MAFSGCDDQSAIKLVPGFFGFNDSSNIIKYSKDRESTVNKTLMRCSTYVKSYYLSTFVPILTMLILLATLSRRCSSFNKVEGIVDTEYNNIVNNKIHGNLCNSHRSFRSKMVIIKAMTCIMATLCGG